MTNINPRLKALADRLKTDLPSENVPIIGENKDHEREVFRPDPARIASPKKYIILPGHKHGSYEYGDLIVSMERSHQKKDWYGAHRLLNKDNAFMLNLRQFVDFLSLLKSGNAFDGAGKKLDRNKLEALYKDIVEVRDPWRGEWLDADFKVVNDELVINYSHRYKGKKLVPQKSEPLEACLTDDKQIQLDYWVNNATRQGLPAKKTPNGSLHYRGPDRDNNSVAWFGASSVGAVLYCNGNPSGSGASLGVRVARKKN